MGGLLDKLTLSTGAPDEEARAGDKRDRVDYDAVAQELVDEAERRLADRDNTSAEQLRSLSSRLFDLANEHAPELTHRNYRAVQVALERTILKAAGSTVLQKLQSVKPHRRPAPSFRRVVVVVVLLLLLVVVER